MLEMDQQKLETLIENIDYINNQLVDEATEKYVKINNYDTYIHIPVYKLKFFVKEILNTAKEIINEKFQKNKEKLELEKLKKEANLYNELIKRKDVQELLEEEICIQTLIRHESQDCELMKAVICKKNNEWFMEFKERSSQAWNPNAFFDKDIKYGKIFSSNDEMVGPGFVLLPDGRKMKSTNMSKIFFLINTRNDKHFMKPDGWKEIIVDEILYIYQAYSN